MNTKNPADSGYGHDLADTSSLISPPPRRDVHYVPLMDGVGSFLAGLATPKKAFKAVVVVLAAFAALWLFVATGLL